MHRFLDKLYVAKDDDGLQLRREFHNSKTHINSYGYAIYNDINYMDFNNAVEPAQYIFKDNIINLVVNKGFGLIFDAISFNTKLSSHFSLHFYIDEVLIMNIYSELLDELPTITDKYTIYKLPKYLFKWLLFLNDNIKKNIKIELKLSPTMEINTKIDCVVKLHLTEIYFRDELYNEIKYYNIMVNYINKPINTVSNKKINLYFNNVLTGLFIKCNNKILNYKMFIKGQIRFNLDEIDTYLHLQKINESIYFFSLRLHSDYTKFTNCGLVGNMLIIEEKKYLENDVNPDVCIEINTENECDISIYMYESAIFTYGTTIDNYGVSLENPRWQHRFNNTAYYTGCKLADYPLNIY